MYAYHPRLHRNSRLQHTTILDVALGENLYSDGPDRWGSLACMRRQASSFTSSMITAVRGIKKMIPMMPKSFPPIIAATRVYSGESPTDFPTTRVDELVFNKLYGKVNNETAHSQNGIHQQHEEHADYAGNQRSDVGDNGADGGQHSHQAAVGDLENGKRKSHENAKDHGLAALPRQKVCKGLPEQSAELQQPVGMAGLQVGTDQCAGVVAETL